MNQELELQLKQQLKLNPQLQQSLKLLQLSQLELAQEIQMQLESNPLFNSDDSNQQEPELNSSEISITASSQINPNTNYSLDENYWEKVADTKDLKEKLEHQLQLHNLSRLDLEIGYYIIENLNEQGFLIADENEICMQLMRDTGHKATCAEVTTIKHLIQSFEPSGCASNNLQEFLLFQINDSKTFKHRAPSTKLVAELVAEHFNLLANQQYQLISSKLNISLEQTKSLLSQIQSFRQRPNDYQAESVNNYIRPDIAVRNLNGNWRAQVIKNNTPLLSVNKTYLELAKNSSDPAEIKYIKDKAFQAQQFIHALEARHTTLQKVANYLVQYQTQYFEHGDIALKPLKLNDLADALELHESTISRATRNKYIQTPNGVLPMKSLFSNAINTTKGGDWSQTAVKSQIQQLIQAEPSRKPLSDNSIVRLLNDKGIKIARRTVAKYRDSLQIPSASKRKQLSALQ